VLRHAAVIAAVAFVGSDTRVPQSLAALVQFHDVVPALTAPIGQVVRVSTEPQLQRAVATVASGQTILVSPGTYRLTKTLSVGGRALHDVAIRGDSRSRDDVVLVGTGMTNGGAGEVPFGIWTGDGVERILIANITLRDFYVHPIIFNAGTRAPHVYNVALIDGGEQLLKSNPTRAGAGVNDGVVEYSLFAYSSTSRDAYTNAIDVHGGVNWTIRHNRFVNIRAPRGQLAGPAILVWRGSAATVIDSNTFLNCQREISLGLEDISDGRGRDPINAPYVDHVGGVVKNNMIARDPLISGDVAILVAASPNTQVLHNTILMRSTYPNAIEYRFTTTTRALIANNLTDRAIVARNGARADVHDNRTSADADMFVEPDHGDLHVRPTARAGLGHGQWMPAAGVDWDGDPRPMDIAPELGADEVGR